MLPPEIEAVYKKVLKQSAKVANQSLRDYYLNQQYGAESSLPKAFAKLRQESLAMMRLGWNPLRPNFKSPSGLGFSMSDMDAYRLRNEQDIVSEIATEAIFRALSKYSEDFITVFLQDVLITPQSESWFDPPKWDPSVQRYRDTRGRFSKRL